MTTPFTNTADIIKYARASCPSDFRSGRAFGKALGISQNMVSLLEHGRCDVKDERLAAWFNDQRSWVSEIAIEITLLRIRKLLQAKLHTIYIPQPVP